MTKKLDGLTNLATMSKNNKILLKTCEKSEKCLQRTSKESKEMFVKDDILKSKLNKRR